MTNIVNVKKEVNNDGSVSFDLPEGYHTWYPDKFMRSQKYRDLKMENPDLKVYDLSKSYLTYTIPKKPMTKHAIKQLLFS